jgi:TrmH family RNA methyltransferase
MVPRPLKWYKSLASAKGRDQARAFLVEGPRAVQQILSVNPSSVIEILAAEGVEVRATPTAPVRRLSGPQLESVTATKTPQGIVAVVAVPPDASSDRLPASFSGHILVCEHVQDPGNVGTLIRSAAALGFGGVILSDKAADPFGPKAVQASAGSVLSIWTRRTAGYIRLVAELKTKGYRVAAADVRGDETSSWSSPARPTVLALGSEGAGLSDELLGLADVRFRIPIDGRKVESLNVAVAGAIAMYRLSLSIQ